MENKTLFFNGSDNAIAVTLKPNAYFISVDVDALITTDKDEVEHKYDHIRTDGLKTADYNKAFKFVYDKIVEEYEIILNAGEIQRLVKLFTPKA